MNYKHIYHAGNFADVAKHVALVACLTALGRKPGAFFVLDTHAGRAAYDLECAEARKSGEAERGVQRLLARADRALLAPYLEALEATPDRPLACYSGSPRLIARALRAQDRAVFVEIDPREARAAAAQIHSAGRVRVQVGDGYAALRAELPPPERRGLVLIDPPYEDLTEFERVAQGLREAWRRWQTGVLLAWYPIRSAAQRREAHARFRALAIPKMLSADLAVYPDDAGLGLAGSGVLLINPPFGLEEYLRAAYQAIHDAIAAPGAGYVEVLRLTPERAALRNATRSPDGP